MEITLQELVSAINCGHCEADETSFRIGAQYLIRTATVYVTGRIKAITRTDLVLENAAWIPDAGRFHTCLRDSVVNESEPFVHDCIVSRGGIIDATEWSGRLPSEQK